MQKFDKFLRNITDLIETGLVSSKDLKKEFENMLKFQSEALIHKLDLVKRDEFEVQKKLVNKLQKELKNIKKNKRKKIKKAK